MGLLFFCLFALFTISFGTHDQFGLPKHINEVAFKYEGTLKERRGTFPITGKFQFRRLDTRIEMVDDVDLDINGKKVNIKHWIIVEDEKQSGYVLVNNKRCFVTEFTKESGTYPRLTPWREIGDNKFEHTLTTEFSLKQILKNVVGRKLGSILDKKHDLNMQLKLKFLKNKIQNLVAVLTVDGERIAKKDVRVTEYQDMNESLFQIPDVCKSPAKMPSREELNNFLSILGLRSIIERRQQTEEMEPEQREVREGEGENSQELEGEGEKSKEHVGESSQVHESEGEGEGEGEVDGEQRHSMKRQDENEYEGEREGRGEYEGEREGRGEHEGEYEGERRGEHEGDK